jgi:cell division protein FtsQ
MSTASIDYRLIVPRRNNRKVDSARGRIRRSIRGLICTIIGAFYLIIVAMAFLLAVAVVVVCLLSSPALEVKNIEFAGLNRVARQDLQATMDLWPKDNILSISLEELGRKALNHPWIRYADVQRKLPDTIKVRVAERSPIAIIQLDKLYYVDDQGSIFARVTAQEGLDFPVITGLEQKDVVDANSRVRRMLEQALGMIKFFSHNKDLLPNPISEVHVDPVLGLTLVLEDNSASILLGSEGELEKVGRLHMVLDALEREGKRQAVSRIDLNYRDRVVVSLRP